MSVALINSEEAFVTFMTRLQKKLISLGLYSLRHSGHGKWTLLGLEMLDTTLMAKVHKKANQYDVKTTVLRKPRVCFRAQTSWWQ